MTLLLKSVWRHVLKGNPIGKFTSRSRSLSSSISELTQNKPQDAIMTRIKCSPSPADVLSTVQTHLAIMTHKHLLQALRTLLELHRQGRFEQEPETIVQDPAFGLLCQNFKKHARSLDVNDAIEAIKVLSYLKIPVDSLIVQTMLQMIRCNINNLNLRQIMFLDFVLTRFDKNYLVDALKLALPLAFQIHLPLELDNQDLPLLKDMLAYSCMHDLPDRCVNSIVTGLLLHDQAIDAKIAKSVIWSLCEVNCTEERFPTRVQLLHICFDILTQSVNQLTYDEVLKTAAKLKGRILEKHPEYYHEQLMDGFANYVIQNEVEFEKGLLVARVLSRVAHTHLGLVEYLCSLAASSPTMLSNARANILFGFINTLSNNNFTPHPDQWLELRRQISLNPILNVTNTALPWLKVCLELASLGHYEDRLLSQVFSKDFLDEYLANNDNNRLDYLQLLTLHEAVRSFHDAAYALPGEVLARAQSAYPTHALTERLEEHAARGLGGPQYVVRNIVLPNGFVADVLICLKGGYPLALPMLGGNDKLPIDQLNLPQGGVVVCIMNFNLGCYSMNSNRLRGTFRLVLDILEKQGYATVPINTSEWLAAPAHERTPYLMREIGYKCGEIGMKLSAT